MTTYDMNDLREKRTANLFSEAPRLENTSYGEEADLRKGDGRKIQVKYGRDVVEYFVPSNAAWSAGRGSIRIDEAYRIVEEDNTDIVARRVESPSELASVAAGFLEEIENVLGRLEDK